MLPFAKLPTDWLARPKWLRLRALLPDDRFWTAAGVYWAVYAESIRDEASGASIIDYGFPADSDVATALVDADLIQANDCTVPSAMVAAALPRARGRADRGPRDDVRPSYEDSDSTETETVRARDLAPGWHAAALPAFQWLNANVAYVDPMDGLGRLLGERTAALGADEVIRRLDIIQHEAGLDPGDTAGYIFGVTDRFRPAAGGAKTRDVADHDRLLASVRQRAEEGPER